MLSIQSRQDKGSAPPPESHVPGVAIFFIILIILLVLGYGGWVYWSRRRASQLGLPPPSLIPFKSSSGGRGGNYPAPAPGGVLGWFNDKFRNIKNKRFASGAGYEGAGRSRGGAHAPLDPDEAWDTRVGNEADGPGGYYEEQELGLHEPSPYRGAGYGEPTGTITEAERGRSRTRELDNRYDEEMLGGANTKRENPFGDENEAPSLRGVSPRPIDTEMGARQGRSPHRKQGSGDSPTERRSMFRENM